MTSVAGSVNGTIRQAANFLPLVTAQLTGTFQSVGTELLQASEAWEGESERRRAEVTSWRYSLLFIFHEIIHLAVLVASLFLICCANIIVFLLVPPFLPRKASTPGSLPLELARREAKVCSEYPESDPAEDLALNLEGEGGEQGTLGGANATLGDLESFTNYQLSLNASTEWHGPDASINLTAKAAGKVLIHGGCSGRADKLEVWGGDVSLTAPCSRGSSHSASVLPGRGVLVAGVGNTRSGCELVDPVSLRSKSVTALPEPRDFHSSVTLGSHVLIAGGNVPYYRSSTLLYRKDTWEPCMAMKENRQSFGMATDGTAAYVFGGIDFKNFVMATCERYDPVSNRWTQLPKLPSPTGFNAAVYLAGRFYVIGGIFGDREVWVLDPKSKCWEKGPDLNRSRSQHCAVAIDNRIWVFGGKEDKKTVENYDPNRNAWTLSPTELQLPCLYSAAVVLPQD